MNADVTFEPTGKKELTTDIFSRGDGFGIRPGHISCGVGSR